MGASAATDQALRVQIWGAFQVLGPDGSDLTPSKAKSRAFLALIATSSDLTRSRAWVQDKLWHGRAPDQAGNSLRQTLHDVRRALGPHKDKLKADRQSISLDAAAITVLEKGREEAVFLDGLSIRDREFNLWLTHRRVQSSSPGRAIATAPHTLMPGLRRRRLHLSVFRGTSPEADWIATSVTDQASGILREAIPAEVAVHVLETGAMIPAAVRDYDLSLEVQVAPVSLGDVAMRLSVSSGATGARLWARVFQLNTASLRLVDDPNLAHAVNALVEGVSLHLTDQRMQARGHARADLEPILEKIFSMDADALRDADQLLAAFADEMQDPTFTAWRAQIRVIQYIERLDLNLPALADAAKSFVAQALEQDRFNATALSVAANTAHFLEVDSVKAAALARHAVEIQPFNPLARWSLSTASLYIGDETAAAHNALYGSHMTRHSQRRFWWELQRGATALVQNRLADAQEAFEFVHSRQPKFRPPLRYLIALYAHGGRWDEAAAMVAKLEAIEDDFSVRRLLEDHAYPASLIRRTEALAEDRLRSLI